MKFNLAQSKNKILIVAVFSIAMGFLEAIVVVYLRELYYPSGFSFPMKLIPDRIYLIEIIREITTIVMLASIGFLAGENKSKKFAYFLFSFAMWDIFYYVALKLFLNWPTSFLTWDILFLIPIPWLGPVLAPLLCSLGMILYALVIIQSENSGYAFKLKNLEFFLILVGIITIVSTFLKDYFLLIFNGNFANKFFTLLSNEEFMNISSRYVPYQFNWIVFSFGAFLILIGLYLFIKRTKT